MDQYSQNKSINAIILLGSSPYVSRSASKKKKERKNVSKVATRKYICILCNVHCIGSMHFYGPFSSIDKARKRSEMIFPEKHYIYRLVLHAF